MTEALHEVLNFLWLWAIWWAAFYAFLIMVAIIALWMITRRPL